MEFRRKRERDMHLEKREEKHRHALEKREKEFTLRKEQGGERLRHSTERAAQSLFPEGFYLEVSWEDLNRIFISFPSVSF